MTFSSYAVPSWVRVSGSATTSHTGVLQSYPVHPGAHTQTSGAPQNPPLAQRKQPSPPCVYTTIVRYNIHKSLSKTAKFANFICQCADSFALPQTNCTKIKLRQLHQNKRHASLPHCTHHVVIVVCRRSVNICTKRIKVALRINTNHKDISVRTSIYSKNSISINRPMP